MATGLSVIIGGNVLCAEAPAVVLHFDISKRDALVGSNVGIDDIEKTVARAAITATQETGGLLSAGYDNSMALAVKQWDDDLSYLDLVDITAKCIPAGEAERFLSGGEAATAFATVQDKGMAGNWVSCLRADVSNWEAQSVDNWSMDGRCTYAASFYAVPPMSDNDQVFYMRFIPSTVQMGEQGTGGQTHTLIVDYKGTMSYYVGDKATFIQNIGPVPFYQENRVEVHRYRNALLLKTNFAGTIEADFSREVPVSADGQSEPTAGVQFGFLRGGISGARLLKGRYYEQGDVYTSWLPYPVDNAFAAPVPSVQGRVWDRVVDPDYGPPGATITYEMEDTSRFEGGRTQRYARIHASLTSTGDATGCLLSSAIKFPRQGVGKTTPPVDITNFVRRITRHCSMDSNSRDLSITLIDDHFNPIFDDPPRLVERPITVEYLGLVFFVGIIKSAEWVWPAKNIRGVELKCKDRWCLLEEASIGRREFKNQTVGNAMLELLTDVGMEDRATFNGEAFTTMIPELFTKGIVKTKSGMSYAEILNQLQKIWCPRYMLCFLVDGFFKGTHLGGYDPPGEKAPNALDPAVRRIFFPYERDETATVEWAMPEGYPYYFRERPAHATSSAGFFNEIWVIGRDSQTYRPIIARWIDYRSLRDPDWAYYTGYRKWYAVYNTAVTDIGTANVMAKQLAAIVNEFTAEEEWVSWYDSEIGPGDLVVAMDSQMQECSPWFVKAMEVEISRQGQLDQETGTWYPAKCTYTVTYAKELEGAWEKDVAGSPWLLRDL